MLGFQVSVRREASDAVADAADSLAWWQCTDVALLRNLVGQGRAELVLDYGGCPDTYRVVAREILHLFEPGVRDELPDVLALTSGIGSRWALKVDDSAVAECPPDATLMVDVWDQS
jgi:hypothetical protein